MVRTFTRRGVFLAATAALVLGISGCGGGSDGGAPPDLYVAYEGIAEGMSVAEATSVVGFASNAGTERLPTEVTHKWETGVGTASYTMLSVTFTDGLGATSKVVNGPQGRRNLTWNFNVSRRAAWPVSGFN